VGQNLLPEAQGQPLQLSAATWPSGFASRRPEGVRGEAASSVLPTQGFPSTKLDHLRTQAEWQDFLHEHYPWLDSTGQPSSLFEAEVRCHRFATSSLALIRSASTEVDRGPRLMGPSEAGHVQIVLQMEGQMEIFQDRASSVILPGQAFICDSARPYHATLSEGAQFSVLTMPHEVLPGWGRISRSLCGLPLSDVTSVLAAQGALNGLLRAPAELDSEGMGHVLQAVQWMLASSLHRCAGRSKPISREGQRLGKARQYILDHIDDPKLGPDELADALHMSRRALYLLFQQCESTPSRMIHELRLERCRDALSDPVHQLRSVTEIAGDFGFQEPASLSRSFKARFGVTPSDWRRQALDAQLRSTNCI